jgi:hypothetical protein
MWGRSRRLAIGETKRLVQPALSRRCARPNEGWPIVSAIGFGTWGASCDGDEREMSARYLARAAPYWQHHRSHHRRRWLRDRSCSRLCEPNREYEHARLGANRDLPCCCVGRSSDRIRCEFAGRANSAVGRNARVPGNLLRHAGACLANCRCAHGLALSRDREGARQIARCLKPAQCRLSLLMIGADVRARLLDARLH